MRMSYAGRAAEAIAGPRHTVELEVLGPWSLRTSRTFWEGFAPAALPADDDQAPESLTTAFVVDADWSPAGASVVEERSGEHSSARITVVGEGDLDAAAAQVARFLAIDVDGRVWPEIGRRDPVIADAQQRLPGLRPCGFHSPYEAAAWAVLSQRTRIVDAARLRDRIITEHGVAGTFPAPAALLAIELDLPGRKTEYLHAVAEAALDGRLDGAELRRIDPAEAIDRVGQILGIGPFGAELVVLRGANAPDVVPHHERRLENAVAERYGADHPLDQVAQRWSPLRTWGCVHLRALA